jgi:phage gpG-like protein
VNDPLKPLLDLNDRIQAGKKLILTAAAVALEGAIKEELSHPGTGVVYVVGRTKGRLRKDGTRGKGKSTTHQASAPGEPPAPDTGLLRNSIHHEVDDDKATVGTNLEYAQPLEFGTTSAGKGHHTVIAPRPFMRPALAKVRDQLNGIVVSGLRSAGSGR